MLNQTSNDRHSQLIDLFGPIEYDKPETYNGLVDRDFPLDREIMEKKSKNIELYSLRYRNKQDLFSGESLDRKPLEFWVGVKLKKATTRISV